MERHSHLRRTLAPNHTRTMLNTFTQTLAIGSTVAISLAVNSGLGKRNALLQNVNIEQIQRSTYAATIFYVLTVGVSKLSITTFLSRLACTSRHKNARILLCALVVCWTVAITIGVVFECELPRPWQVLTGRCIRMVRIDMIKYSTLLR